MDKLVITPGVEVLNAGDIIEASCEIFSGPRALDKERYVFGTRGRFHFDDVDISFPSFYLFYS